MYPVLMFLWAVVSGGYGVIVLLGATTALHEIEGTLAIVIATISGGFAFVLDTMDSQQKRREQDARALRSLLEEGREQRL